MATLYEIKQEIADLIDFETGEIKDVEKLEALQMDKHEKLCSIAHVFLNAKSDAKQYEEEEKKFAKRRKSQESLMKWAKDTLMAELGGKKMKETEFSISYTTRSSVDDFDHATIPEKYHIKQEDKINKTLIKEDINNGIEVPGARLVDNTYIQIR